MLQEIPIEWNYLPMFNQTYDMMWDLMLRNVISGIRFNFPTRSLLLSELKKLEYC